MALELDYEDEYGNRNQKGYFRVEKFHLFADERKCDIRLRGYTDIDAREEGKKPLVEFKYSVTNGTVDSDFDNFFDMSNFEGTETNHIKQCYLFLKTQDQWENALDV